MQIDNNYPFALADFGNAPYFDADTLSYINRVEQADGLPLEAGVKVAYNTFITGCKTDGIWNAIKASCIMAGARTLNGALQPLVGTAPTNFNFVSGDYDRKTGLKGDGSTKYLDSNRNNNADPQNSYSLSVLVTEAQSNTTGMALIGGGGINTGASGLANAGANIAARNRNSSSVANGMAFPASGFIGTNRNASNTYIIRSNGTNTTQSTTSQTPANQNIGVFTRSLAASSDGRIAFYHIGEALDLALLDARITQLINNIGRAII